jgi:hypothetical protein
LIDEDAGAAGFALFLLFSDGLLLEKVLFGDFEGYEVSA